MKNLNTTSRSLGKYLESRSSVQDCALRTRGCVEVLVFAPVVGIQEVTMKKHTKSRRVTGAAATPTKKSRTPSDAGMALNATTAKKKFNPTWLRELNAATSFIVGGAK
jgi:hypothetical protein